MSETLLAALIAALGVIVVALSSGVVANLVRLNQRIRRLEHRDRLSWLYIQDLIHHAYKHEALPLPDPPEGWLEPLT